MIVYVMLWAFSLVLGGSAVWALIWSVNQGHMRTMEDQAKSIFDGGDGLSSSQDAQSLSTRGD